MAQNWQILRTESDTYKEAAQLLGRAFVDEPVSIRVYRNLSPEKRLKNLVVDFIGELSVGIQHGEPVHIRQGDKIAAAALIYPPKAYPLSRLNELRLLFWTVWGHSPYDIRIWMQWLAQAGKQHPQEPHYYLEYVGVEPGLQGRGLGSCILEHLTSKADQAQLGCYLETATRKNLSLYQRFGFQVFHVEEIIGLPVWFMWRPHT
jgi:GNAT superfamily N-acetyltransferase